MPAPVNVPRPNTVPPFTHFPNGVQVSDVLLDQWPGGPTSLITLLATTMSFTLDSIEALRALLPSSTDTEEIIISDGPPVEISTIPLRVFVSGYYLPGDGGQGFFYWDALSSATDNGGTVINPTGNTDAGRWIRIVLDGLNVAMFGALGGGVLQETAKLQSAFDTSYSTSLPLYFNGGNYLTDTLVYKGQTLIGIGSGLLTSDTFTSITGLAGKDILLAPDPSTGASGAADFSLKGFYIKGIQFRLNRSSAGSFSRPVWPIHGQWTTGTAYQSDMLVTNSSGKIYGCRTTGTSGATEPTHTRGVASDGTLNWVYLAPAQQMLANACIAFPLNDNAVNPGYNTYIYRPEMYDVVFDEGTGGSANTCCFFTQRGMYGWLGSNIIFRQNFYGLCITQSNIFDAGIPTRGSSGCELLDMDSVEFLNNTCFIQNGQNLIAKNFRFYSQSGGRNLLYLPLVYDKTPVSAVGGTHKFHALYVENGQNASTWQAFYIDGTEHMFDFNQCSFGPESFCGWMASRCDVFGLTYGNFDHIGSSGTPGLGIFGNQNKFAFGATNFITLPPQNTGNGNSLTIIDTAGIPYVGQREYEMVGRHRASAAMQDGAFGALGFASTPFDSINDLLIDPREQAWIEQGTNLVRGFTRVVDPTLESGGYLRVTTANGVVSNGYFGSGNFGFTIGRTWPSAYCIVNMKLRAGTAGNQTIVFQIKNENTIVGSSSQTISLTTDWALYSFALDLSMFNTRTVGIGINTPSGSAPNKYCDMAWVLPMPIPPNVPLRSYTVTQAVAYAPVGNGMIYVSNETGGAVPAFWDGSNWRRVTDRAIVS